MMTLDELEVGVMTSKVVTGLELLTPNKLLVEFQNKPGD